MSNEGDIPSSLRKIWETDNISSPALGHFCSVSNSHRKKKVVGYSSGSKPRVAESDWARFEARVETVQDITEELRQSVCVLAADSDDELIHLMEIMKDVLYDLREVASNKIHNLDEDEI